jgi:hypothetical protein
VIHRSEALRELATREGVSARAVDELVDSLLRGHVPPGAEALAPLLLPGTETAFDFLPDDTLVVIDDLEAGRQRMLRYAEESLENYELARGSGRLVCAPSEVALNPEQLEHEALARRALILEQIDLADQADGIERLAITTRGHAELRAQLARARAGDTALAPLARRIADWRAARYRIVLVDRIALARRTAARAARRLPRRGGRGERPAAVLALVGGRARRDPDRGAVRGLHASVRPARARHRGGDLRAAREAARRDQPGLARGRRARVARAARARRLPRARRARHRHLPRPRRPRAARRRG